MSRAPRRVRRLVLGAFIGAAALNAAIFLFLSVLFSYDLEDKIFQDQAASAADRLVAAGPTELSPSGTVAATRMQYFVGRGSMPNWLRTHPVVTEGAVSAEIFGENRGHFHMVTRELENGERLYVLFDARPFVRSTQNIKLYLAIASAMAFLIFGASFFHLRKMIRSLSDPLQGLASQMSNSSIDQTHRYEVPAEAPAEIYTLAEAIHHRNERINALLEREKAFNRDASHELRTPLAVATGALEVLEEQSRPSRVLNRLKTALYDMQRMVDGILWLGRDPVFDRHCQAGEIVARSWRAHEHMARARGITCSQNVEVDDHIPVPEAVGLVLVGNLIRNAIAYSHEGPIQIDVGPGRIRVRDSGVGFGQVDESARGFGVGLSLVERLCAHFAIELDISSRPGGGTDATLSWPVAV